MDKVMSHKAMELLAMYRGFLAKSNQIPRRDLLDFYLNPPWPPKINKFESNLPPEIIEHNAEIDKCRAARIERRRANR